MKYFVSIGAQTDEVEVDGNRVTVDGVGLETDLVAVSGTPLYHLLLAGASWTVAAEPLEGAGRWTLGLVGERVEVAVQDERSRGIEAGSGTNKRSEEHTSELQSQSKLVCRLLLEKKKKKKQTRRTHEL